jgi:SAM-dependent methyltransferase
VWDVSDEWYADAAEHYERGRLPYPSALESLFEAAVGRCGRLLDVGCGPGTVGLRLAGLFEYLVGVDRDAGMVEHARSRAAAMNLKTARFIRGSVEDLPTDLGPFRVVIVAQAFHWFDGPRAAEAILRLLEPGGHCVVVYAWSLRGDPAPDIALPEPPYAAMDVLSERLGGLRGGPPRTAPDDESGPMTAAGFDGPDGWRVPGGEVVVSSAGDLIARWLSRSDAAAFRTGPRRVEYIAAAEKILRNASEAGFAERLRDARFNVWTKPS